MKGTKIVVKFKRGDKVKLTTLDDIGRHAPHLKVGDIGNIRSTLGFYIVEFENLEPGLRNTYEFEAFELELVKET